MVPSSPDSARSAALAPPSPRAAATWRLLQGVVLLATGGFLVALRVRPDLSLALFWGLVVPLLPLSFLITPLVWRAVCPLATLNMAGNGPGGRRLPAEASRWSGGIAMLALALLVPARHFAFNVRGEALTVLVLGAAIAAWALGTRYEARAGFCNFLCPVLPVERLYGQHPLVALGSGRCATCTVCTPRGCLDLAGPKTNAQLLGPARRSRAWLVTATGLFATAFPGFVIGYFTVTPDHTGDALAVYQHVFTATLAGGAITWAACALTGVGSAMALPCLAALSAAAYYWFAIPVVLRTLGADTVAVVWILRAALALFVGWWLWRALRAAPPVGGARSASQRQLPLAAGD